jgi:hypothetical protein
VGVFAMLLFALTPGVASASVTGGCWGTATFEGDPVEYDPSYDTRSNAIPIPNKEGVSVAWTGTTPWGNEDHSGKITLAIAGLNIKVADWQGDDKDDSEEEGDYELDEARDAVSKFVPLDFLIGIYKVNGEHSAKAGSCTGFAFVKFGDNPLSSVVGWIVIGGLIVTASGLVIAFRSRPIPIVRGRP